MDAAAGRYRHRNDPSREFVDNVHTTADLHRSSLSTKLQWRSIALFKRELVWPGMCKLVHVLPPNQSIHQVELLCMSAPRSQPHCL